MRVFPPGQNYVADRDYSLCMSRHYFETLKLTLTVTETVFGMVEVS